MTMLYKHNCTDVFSVMDKALIEHGLSLDLSHIDHLYCYPVIEMCLGMG